jgi:type IV fimbrial biogenesis protein FimT
MQTPLPPWCRPRAARRAVRTPSLGFTLIELLVVVAILALLAGLVAPNFAGVADRATVASFTNAFVAHMHLARSEAIKRNGRVVMCKSPDGLACAADGRWDQGWVVFHDADGNGQLDAGEQVLQKMKRLPSVFHFSGNLHVSRYVSFSPMGGTRLSSGGFQAGTLTLCKPSAFGNTARQIVINSAGRARLQDKAPAECG